MKKIIIILATILAVTFIVFLFILIFKNPATEQVIQSKEFQIELTYENQTISGLKYENQTWSDIPLNEIMNYVEVSYNRTHDVLWVLCNNGYTMSSATSQTDKNIIVDQSVGASINLFEGQKNSINITCKENPQN